MSTSWRSFELWTGSASGETLMIELVTPGEGFYDDSVEAFASQHILQLLNEIPLIP